MNLTKFLLIDVALILLGLPTVLIFQGRMKKASFLNETDLANLTLFKLPDQEKLLEFEKIARKNGSGIESDSLIGCWKFVSVWKQGTDKEDSISSSLLRLFSASLEINKDKPNQFSILNSIKFGLLSIQFLGTGNLKGKQPLLPFFFNCIQLKAGSSILFSRSLQIPEEKMMPFFALIAMGENSQWLSARGRGGGLALWIRG